MAADARGRRGRARPCTRCGTTSSSCAGSASTRRRRRRGSARAGDARARRRAARGRRPRSAAGAIVGFAPGAAYGHAKRWPPDRVAQVVAGAQRSAALAPVLVGRRRRSRHGACDRIERCRRASRVIDLIGRTDLAAARRASWRAAAAFVSNDSGAMHVAAALGVPLTAIFGPTDERVTAPMGRRRATSSCATCSAGRACCANVRSIIDA